MVRYSFIGYRDIHKRLLNSVFPKGGMELACWPLTYRGKKAIYLDID